MKYLKDDETKVLKNEEDLMEYLSFRKENDHWVGLDTGEFPKIKSCAVVGIENHPLFIPQYCEDNGIKETESVMECINDIGLFLAFPDKGKTRIEPIRGIAYDSICGRAGLSGLTIRNFISSSQKEALPLLEKAAWLTRGMSLYGQTCKILVRDEKVSAVLSSDYAILPADELIDVIRNSLTQCSAIEYAGGEVSHEYLQVSYYIDDTTINEGFRCSLEEAGLDLTGKTVRCGCTFITSDVGLSRAFVSPTVTFIEQNGKALSIRVGNGVSLKHEGNAALDKFSAMMVGFTSLFEEAEDQIEKLGNTELSNLPAVITKLADENRVTFPKQFTEDVVSGLPLSGTAMDAYLALLEIVENYNQTKGLNLSTYLNLLDRVTKFMYVDFRKWDE